MAHSATLGGFGDMTEATRALAGVRELLQATAAPTTGAEAGYTVQNAETRRVMVFHLGASSPAAGDIRFKCNGTATASNMPLVPQKYALFELSGPRTIGSTSQAGETISFWNTSADTITVYILELM